KPSSVRTRPMSDELLDVAIATAGGQELWNTLHGLKVDIAIGGPIAQPLHLLESRRGSKPSAADQFRAPGPQRPRSADSGTPFRDGASGRIVPSRPDLRLSQSRSRTLRAVALLTRPCGGRPAVGVGTPGAHPNAGRPLRLSGCGPARGWRRRPARLHIW